MIPALPMATTIFQFLLVSGAVVVADHRRASDGIPDIHRRKDKGYVHDDPVGRHTVFTGQAHKLVIVQDIDDG